MILFQAFKLKNNLVQKEIITVELKKQQFKINSLKNNYRLKSRNFNLKEKNISLKDSTAEILNKLKTLNLNLIDFSSTKTELNLNINGNFHSLLKLLYYLENEISGIKIKELKLKNNDNNLFFYIKLKNELI